MTREKNTLHRIDLIVFIWGVIMCTAALLFYKKDIFVSVLIGAAVAQLNWTVFRRVGFFFASKGNKAHLLTFLGIKSAALIGLVLLILASGIAKPLPFMIGISSLLLGMFTHTGIESTHTQADSADEENR